MERHLFEASLKVSCLSLELINGESRHVLGVSSRQLLLRRASNRKFAPVGSLGSLNVSGAFGEIAANSGRNTSRPFSSRKDASLYVVSIFPSSTERTKLGIKL